MFKSTASLWILLLFLLIVNQLYPLLSSAFVGVGQIKPVKMTEFAVMVFIVI